ncbi:MAG: DUF4831 family protein [Myxococcales bacterium]|nr:DUF4831 family protein [Myxococcota bacterium]MDW8283521.1 DUF4831 family protein [Myxococcales bacterium]
MSKCHAPALAALAATLVGGCASYSVYRVPRTRPEGAVRLPFPAVFYALPRAVLTVEVHITRTTTRPGECARFRDLAREMGIPDSALVSAPRVEYSQSGFHIGERLEPDPDQVFAIRIDDEALRNRTQDIELSQQGFLTRTEVETTSKVEDFVTQTLEATADIVGRVFRVFGAGEERGRPEDALRRRCAEYKQEYMSYQRRRRELLTPVASGPPPPADTLRLVLAQIEQREAYLRSRFTGTQSVDSAPLRCEYTPESRYGTGTTQLATFRPLVHKALYRFSPATGLSQVDPSCTVGPELAPDQGAYIAAWRRVLQARLEAHLAAEPGRAELLRRCDEDLLRAGAAEGFIARLALQWAQELARSLSAPLGAGHTEAVLSGLAAAVRALEPPALVPPPGQALAESAREPAGAPKNLPPLRGVTGARVPQAPAVEAPRPLQCDGEAMRAMVGGLDWKALTLELARAVEGTPISLWVRVEDPDGQLPAVAATWQRWPHTRAGFFYRIPGTAVVTLGHEERWPLVRTRRLVPQLGVVTALAGPGDVRSLAARYALELHPSLGALRRFGSQTKALSAGAAAAVKRAGAELLGGLQERREAEQNRELQELVRERTLLEEKKKIRALRMELDRPVPTPTPPVTAASPAVEP